MSKAKFAFLLLPFLVLAVLNSGGYRYGASDQAFYLPAVFLKLHPELYPRDASLLTAQSRLTTSDETVALIVRITRGSIPAVFAALQVVTLTLIALGAWLVAHKVYRTAWATAALLAAMTLRHAIARSGTNTLEGYFHPRELAFGLGLIAVALFLRGRFAAVALLIAMAGALHPTAALWFAAWLAAAAAIASPALRRWLMFAALPAAAVAVWMFTAGPLAGRLGVMDDQWLHMLRDKQYLFMLHWPLYAWVLNPGSVVVVALIYVARQRAGLVDTRERALVLGSGVLVALFLAFFVLQALHIIISFQLQPARLFLVFDFLGTVYAVWALAEGPRPDPRRARLVALAVVAFSVARSAYVTVQIDRAVIQPTLPDDDWGRAMAWARGTGPGSGWLADPYHSILYGTSLRVAGERDVFVEGVKDTAVGLYDRAIAERTDSRIREVADFTALSADSARRLGRQHGLDYLVTESTLDLPLAFESGALKIYRLR